jgi:hypothetical protein
MGKVRLFLDTDEDAEQVLIEMARRVPVSKKLDMVWSISDSVRDLARIGIRRRYPNATDEEMHCRLAALVFDRETVMTVYGWDPEIEGY